MAAATQTRRILIKVDTSDSKGLEDIAKRMGFLNKNIKDVSGNLGFLTNAFRSWIGFLGVRELVGISDRMQSFNNTLKITTGSVEGAALALQQITDIAKETNQSITDVGQVFNRLTLSLKGSGATTSEVVDLTKTLINSFRVAGATATETANTIIQLSQAFSSGELRGQELRSVMEQNAVLAGLLKDRFGADIYKKAEQGAIKLKDVLQVLADNQEKLNKQAKELTPTFEQALTQGMNVLALAINDLNKAFNLSGNFYKGIEFLVTGLTEINYYAVLIAGALPALVISFNALFVAVSANPLGATVIALAGIAYWIIELGGGVKTMVVELSVLGDAFKALALDIAGTATGIAGLLGGPFEELNDRVKQARMDISKNIAKVRDELARQNIEDDIAKRTGGDAAAKATENLKSLLDKLNAGAKKVKEAKLKDILAGINKEFANGQISLDQYNKKVIDFQLYKLNRQFREGKMDLVAYKEQLSKLNIEGLNRQFAMGNMNFSQFQDAIRNEQISVLTAKFDTGKISVMEYNKELVVLSDTINSATFRAGALGYIETIGTVSANVAGAIQNAFSALEDTFTEFIKTGKLDFKSFTESVLNDMARIIAKQAILKPLTEAGLNLAGLFGGAAGANMGQGGGGQSPMNYTQANGGAWSKGVQMFANGGVVNRPTMFGHSKGVGVMGEAGPEAILPLSRSGTGKLGVEATVTPVTINVINNAGAEVTTQETTGADGGRQLDIMITQKVRSALGNGSLDRSMEQNYGMKRRGL